MINQEQIDVIRKYVPDKYFDQERLIKYLSLHDMVGEEVFEYVAKKFILILQTDTIMCCR